MKRRHCIVLALLALLPVPTLARSSGAEILINAYTKDDQAAPVVAMDRRGNAVVLWQGEGPAGRGVYGRLFDRSGSPRGDQFLVSRANRELGWGESAAFDELGFVAVWSELTSQGLRIFGRTFRTDGSHRSQPFQLGQDHNFGRIALGRDGRILLVAWNQSLFTQLFERDGSPVGEPLALQTSGLGGVAARGAGYVVAWSQPPMQVRAWLLDSDGRPAGEPFTVADGQENNGGVSVASAPDGRFVVSWLSGEGYGVFARLFSSSGSPLTGILKVEDDQERRPGDGNTSVAMDAEGKFLVAWTVYDELDRETDWGNVYGRRYESSGIPAGGPFRLSGSIAGMQNLPSMAAGPADGFFAVWTTAPGPYYAEPQDGSGSAIFGRRLAWARPGSDPCGFGPGGFVCDAAHDGGAAELEVPFRGASGDRPLIGDLNGDGRDDPCLFHRDRFLCDTAHDGGDAEAEIVYGQAGDMPLMGDVDGEGRDDACVRRGTWFLCDTAHDGGTVELAVNFGAVGDKPLLGDLDGDGDDDPCVARGSTFLCDTVHDGLGAEVAIPFGEPKDLPLLGDLDGDGRDDPCVLRKGRLLCDTAHNGGTAELSLRLNLPGVPLLGNVDGL